MASSFGLAGLKSRLADWRQFRMMDRFAKLANRDGPPVPVQDRAHLALLIERHIIPQLMTGLADRNRLGTNSNEAQSAAAGGGVITQADVARFANLALRGDMRALLDATDSHLAAGQSVECLYVELLAPAARSLGIEWEEDRQDFVEVTMALWRIQEVVHALSARVPVSRNNCGISRRALFSTMPGDQHSLGTLMVAETFERAGWHCAVLIDPTASDLNAKLASQTFDMLALTVTCDCPNAALHNLVVAARSVSVNPALRIMLGGRTISAQPDMVGMVGADAMADDAVSALAVADRLISEQSRLYQQP